MGDTSPGQHTSDESMQLNIINYIPDDLKDIIFNLHQISPLNANKLNDIEILLQNLGQKFKDNHDAFEQTRQLYNKIKNFQRKKICYNEKDSGPYTVIFEHKNSNNKGLHPMDLGKRLHGLGIHVKSISKKGFNRVGVVCKTFLEANNILCNEQLAKEGYKVYVPQRFLTSKGIVKDVGFSVQEEDFYNEVNGNTRVIEARRLNRRVVEGQNVTYVPSMTFLVTFEGRNRPSEIEIFSCLTKVHPYIPPVSQCLQCLRFGHKSTQCRSKCRCVNCGKDHAVKDCEEETCCIYCHGEHSAINRNCKEFERQNRINELMSFYDYSYYEASQICPPLIPPKSKESFQRSPQAFPQPSASLINASPKVNHSTRSSFHQPDNTYASAVRGNSQSAKTQPQQKRRKHTLIEKPSIEEGIKNITYPQPSRTASPNGRCLQNNSTQNSPSITQLSSPSPSYSSFTSGDSPIHNILVTPILHSEPKNNSSHTYNVHSDQNVQTNNSAHAEDTLSQNRG